MIRTRSARVAVTAALALGAVGLSGCGTDKTGAAAVIGGERLSVSSVQDRARVIAGVVGENTATANLAGVQAGIVSNEILHVLTTRLADQNDISVTGAQIDSFLDAYTKSQRVTLAELKKRQGFTDATLRSAASDAVKSQALIQKLGDQEKLGAALVAEAKKIGVSVNRRYGSFNPATLGITEGTGAISSVFGTGAVATATPTPAPAPAAQ